MLCVGWVRHGLWKARTEKGLRLNWAEHVVREKGMRVLKSTMEGEKFESKEAAEYSRQY